MGAAKFFVQWRNEYIEFDSKLKALSFAKVNNCKYVGGATRNISQNKKDKIKERDNFTCAICRDEFLPEELEIDHIHPFSAITCYKNGLSKINEDSNLTSVCFRCNKIKSNKHMEIFKI
jgi:superfamily II helicase